MIDNIDKKVRENESRTASNNPDNGTRILTSRRGVLAALVLIGGGGAALSQYGGDDFWDSGDNKEDESNSGDDELLLAQEKDLRSEIHSNRPSMVPSFEYNLISERFDNPEIPIEQVIAEATSETGDQIVFVAEERQAQRLGEAMISFFIDTGNSRSYSTTINSSSVEFDLYIGSRITIGQTLRDSPEPSKESELLIARGYEEATVEQLIDTFDAFYDRLENGG